MSAPRTSGLPLRPPLRPRRARAVWDFGEVEALSLWCSGASAAMLSQLAPKRSAPPPPPPPRPPADLGVGTVVVPKEEPALEAARPRGDAASVQLCMGSPSVVELPPPSCGRSRGEVAVEDDDIDLAGTSKRRSRAAEGRTLGDDDTGDGTASSHLWGSHNDAELPPPPSLGRSCGEAVAEEADVAAGRSKSVPLLVRG